MVGRGTVEKGLGFTGDKRNVILAVPWARCINSEISKEFSVDYFIICKQETESHTERQETWETVCCLCRDALGPVSAVSLYILCSFLPLLFFCCFNT